MSYYESPSWSAGGRQPSWEQPPPPSRSGTNSVPNRQSRAVSDSNAQLGASSTVSRDDSQAFLSQIEEVDRAQDNLLKSGKILSGPGSAGPRRGDLMGGMRSSFDGRSSSGPSRHHSVSDFDGARPGSASMLQNFYNNQRYNYPRNNHGGNDADTMLQSKRKMAAQRERELRNYHQEQQYNRNLSGAKSDRSMSPSTMTEEERRELIARQHRALYGNESSLYTGEPGSARPLSQDARVSGSLAGPRNGSPLAYDPYAVQAGQSNEPAVQMPQRDQGAKDSSAGAEPARANSNSSPSSNPTAFGLFDNAQQSSRTSTASPGGSPPRTGNKTSGGVAPIGTRPTQNPAQPGNLNKRSTTPLPSPLSYGFSASGANESANNATGNATNNTNSNNNNNERSTPPSSVADKGVGLGWGSNSGVWGTGKNLGVQASVWG